MARPAGLCTMSSFLVAKQRQLRWPNCKIQWHFGRFADARQEFNNLSSRQFYYRDLLYKQFGCDQRCNISGAQWAFAGEAYQHTSERRDYGDVKSLLKIIMLHRRGTVMSFRKMVRPLPTLWILHGRKDFRLTVVPGDLLDEARLLTVSFDLWSATKGSFLSCLELDHRWCHLPSRRKTQQRNLHYLFEALGWTAYWRTAPSFWSWILAPSIIAWLVRLPLPCSKIACCLSFCLDVTCGSILLNASGNTSKLVLISSWHTHQALFCHDLSTFRWYYFWRDYPYYKAELLQNYLQ